MLKLFFNTFLFFFFASASKKNIADDKPLKNVLFIVSDDLRPDIGGFYGQNNAVLTPNIESLMNRGVTFTHAYCQQSLCAPSRTSFLTGLRPDTTHIWRIGPYWRDTMPNNTGLDVITLPQYFKENGYYTVGAGKVFHCGSSSGGPTNAEGGSDMPYSWSQPYWYCDQFYNGTFQSTAMQNWPNGTGCVQDESCIQCLNNSGCWGPDIEPSRCGAPCDKQCFPDGAVADQIKKYMKQISENREKYTPFFLGAGLKRPHLSWYAPSHYFELYPNASIQIAQHRTPPLNMPIYAFPNETEIKQTTDAIPHLYYNNESLVMVHENYHAYLRAGYYGAVSFMDDALGDIMDALHEYNFVNDTIVVFIGDHGYHLGEQGAWGKRTVFELGVRVPMVVIIPGVNEGKKVDYNVELLDLFPTIVEAAGLSMSDQLKAQLEGKSLMQLITNPDQVPTFPNYAYSQYPRDGLMGVSLRTDSWRYTEWVSFAFNSTVAYPIWSELFATELYNHTVGIDENDFNAYDNVNLAYYSEYSTIVENLHEILVSTWDNQTWAINYNNKEK